MKGTLRCPDGDSKTKEKQPLLSRSPQSDWGDITQKAFRQITKH